MSLQTMIAPAALPIDIEEARDQLRQDSGVDDAAILGVVRACTSFAQTECRRSLIAQRLKLVLDGFGCGMLSLEYGPVLTVRSITYLDMAGARQTVPAADYVVDASSNPARIAPVFGKVWPSSLPQIGSVEVTFDAGDAAAVTRSGNALVIKGGIWRSLAINDTVRLSNSGGALPAPLQPDTDYYVQSVPTSASFTLSATAGGAVIALTDAGTGTHYIGVIDEAVRAWMKLRLTSLYDLGSDTIQVPRGTLAPLPYVDQLLNGPRADTL